MQEHAKEHEDHRCRFPTPAGPSAAHLPIHMHVGGQGRPREQKYPPRPPSYQISVWPLSARDAPSAGGRGLAAAIPLLPVHIFALSSALLIFPTHLSPSAAPPRRHHLHLRGLHVSGAPTRRGGQTGLAGGRIRRCGAGRPAGLAAGARARGTRCALARSPHGCSMPFTNSRRYCGVL